MSISTSLISFTFFALLTPAASQLRIVELFTQEQRKITLPPHSTYSVTGSSIQVVRHPHQPTLMIRGAQSGTSWISIHQSKTTTQFELRVLPPPTKGHGENTYLRRIQAQLPWLETIIVGQKLQIRGELTTLDELKSFTAWRLPSDFEADVTIGQELLALLNSRIDTTCQLATLRILPTGEVQHQLSEACRKTTHEQWPKLSIFAQNPRTPESQHIHLQVYILKTEISHKQQLGLLLQSPTQISGDLTGAWAGALDAELHHRAEEGQLKILANPELVLKTGEEAELFSGTETAFKNQGKYFAQTEWKSSGLIVKFKLNSGTHTSADLSIQAELSHRLPNEGGESPGFQSNRLKTRIDAELGFPHLLSGLKITEDEISSSGIPFLRDIPIIGALFGSSSFRKNTQELLILILPKNQSSDPRLLERINFPKGPVPLPRYETSDLPK